MSGKKNLLKINLVLKNKLLKILSSTLLMFLAFQSSAIETSMQLHKVDQSGANGFSIGVGDSFFKQREFNWSISYNRVEDINITWDEEDVNFALNTVDLMLSYRYSPKSYNHFVKSLTVELQAGVGVAVTENKFIWSHLNEEKYFSQPGDVNGVVALLVHKKFSKKVSMQLGVKHYPDYSEFGDISSVYLGFSYTFGRQRGY